eukprot:15057371-Ditylum_brightwellii.AAC.1
MEAHSAYSYQMGPRHPTAHELRTIPIDWTPVIDSASVIKEPEMEFTCITQEDAKAKEGEASASADNKVVDNGEKKKENIVQNEAILDPNNKINWKLTLSHCTNEVLAKTLEHTT